MWETILFGGTAALFVWMSLVALWQLRWAPRLPSLDQLRGRRAPDPRQPPSRCSIVVSARNEEARIEATLQHLLAQRDVDLELIIVDDRSTDRTSEVLHRVATQNSSMRVIRVDTLPEGWLGKCHACHLGASAATGEWILFTDADCWLAPDVLFRALRAAELAGAGHVTLSPGTVLESPLTRAWHLLFLTSLLGWFAGVNRDRAKAHVGIGAFNFVRADAYRKCGGYEALRLTVIDDLRLGLLLRRAGVRTRAFLGARDVECHWGKTVWSMVKIMEKNYFAALDFRLGLALAGSLFVCVVLAVLLAGLLGGTPLGMAAAFSPFTLAVPGSILARRVGWPWPSALFTPMMIPVFVYALARSTWITLRQGGVRWRDTFYPLQMLKTGQVRGFGADRQ